VWTLLERINASLDEIQSKPCGKRDTDTLDLRGTRHPIRQQREAWTRKKRPLTFLCGSDTTEKYRMTVNGIDLQVDPQPMLKKMHRQFRKVILRNISQSFRQTWHGMENSKFNAWVKTL
jgi:hypothetical protein